MALTYGFYNSIGHDRKYDAIQVGQIFDGIIKDGVYETYKKALLVKESSVDNQVIVQPGRAWFDHTWTYNDSDLPVSMPAPESFVNRIDAVVLDINQASNARINSITVVTGTPAANPERPTLTQETWHKQYPLCYVYRRGDDNHIYQADITNAVGTSECPFVIGVIEGLSVDDLLARWSSEFETYMRNKKFQWNAFQAGMQSKVSAYESLMEQQFFKWMETEKTKYNRFLRHNEIAWNSWFDHIQTELDGDTAGHLQKQIDDIARFAHIYVVDKTLFVPRSGASVAGKKLIFART